MRGEKRGEGRRGERGEEGRGEKRGEGRRGERGEEGRKEGE